MSQTHVPPPTPAISIITTTPQKEAPTPTEKTLTQEEIEFDDQFRKWEDEFDKWKQANINHPDKVAYKNYEQQFESVRVQLLQVKFISKLQTFVIISLTFVETK